MRRGVWEDARCQASVVRTPWNEDALLLSIHVWPGAQCIASCKACLSLGCHSLCWGCAAEAWASSLHTEPVCAVHWEVELLMAHSPHPKSHQSMAQSP